MLKAVTRQAAAVDAKIQAINNSNRQQHSGGALPISTANFFDHHARPEDVAVMVTEQDFLDAHRELVPSVSAGELAHYERVRATFEGGRDKQPQENANAATVAEAEAEADTFGMTSSVSSPKGKGKAVAAGSVGSSSPSSKGKGKAVAAGEGATASDQQEQEGEDGYPNHHHHQNNNNNNSNNNNYNHNHSNSNSNTNDNGDEYGGASGDTQYPPSYYGVNGTAGGGKGKGKATATSSSFQDGTASDDEGLD